MKKNTTQEYIIKQFSHSFYTIFIPLFIIASLIFIIKLSGYTSVIKISMNELLLLYLYSIPELLFYTFPVTFFITATLSLHRLSLENEILVLFALGLTPFKILKIFLKPSFILTLFLLFDFFVILPTTKVMYRNFIDQKRTEGQFNLSASEMGHEFGEWLVYIGSKGENNTFHDVVMLKPSPVKETIVKAEMAKLINKDGIMTLELSKGKAFSYTKQKVKQMNFRVMHINNKLQESGNDYKSTLEYWFDRSDRDYKRKKFVTSFLLAMFPLISLFVIFSIGIVNARHSNGYVYLNLFVTLVIFFSAVFGLPAQLYMIPIIILASLAVSYFLFYKKILVRF